MTDHFEEIVNRATLGDKVALDQLLEENLGALHAFIRLRAGDAIKAKESTIDIVQSVCREGLADASHFEYQGEKAFKSWLFTQALHKIIDHKRYYERDKRDIAREVPVDNPVGDSEITGLLGLYASICSPSQVAMAREEVERIEGLFQRLNEEQREAVSLVKIAGLSYAEAAEQMQRSEHSVRGLAARGLARLAKMAARR